MADQVVDFNGIPSDILTPGVYVEFDNSLAVQGLTNQTNRIILLAPMLDTGTAEPNVPVQVTSAAEGKRLAGVGSIAASMLSAIFSVTGSVETWLLPIEDPDSGVAAKGTVTVTGSPTESGTLSIYVAGTLVQVGIGVGDTPAEVATAIAAAVNAEADLPCTAQASDKIVTLTCRHKGTIGNDIDLRLNFYASQKTPAGLALELASFADGTGSHDIEDAIAALGTTQYLTMISAFADDVSLPIIETELNKRWGPLFQNDSHCFIGIRGTVGTINSTLSTRSSPHVTAITCETGGEPQPVWEKAALVGAMAAYYLNIDPARPLKELTLPGRLPAAVSKRWTREERNLLLSYGGATTYVDEGGNVVLERCPTTYTQTSSGISDPSYQQTESMYILSRLRYQLRARLLQRFPRCSLVGDETEIPAGSSRVNPKTIRAEIGVLASEWVDAGLIEDRDQFMEDLIVVRDPSVVTRVNVRMSPNLVNQLFVIAVKNSFIL